MNGNKNSNAFEILLVENRKEDIFLIREALMQSGFPIHLAVVKDGTEVLEYLAPCRNQGPNRLPDVICLDLKLPKVNGIDILNQLKTNESYRSIPVVVLSTSDDEEEIVKCYDAHANCFVHKSVDFELFQKHLQSTLEFWLGAVQLPQIN